MRFFCMHRTDKNNEAGVIPDPEVFAGMGPLIEEMMQAGVFVAGEGLRASSHGVRLNFSGGKRTLTPGPFSESKGLIAGFAIVQVKSLDEAIEHATRFAEIVGDVEIDIRPVMEMWDLGMGSKPPGLLTTRYMMTHKPAVVHDDSNPPSPQMMAAMAKLIDEMTKAGVLLMSVGLRPSAQSLRLKFSGGKPTVIDGPFAESKELIAGFSILELSSKQEAIERSVAFAKVVGDVEIDIRPMYEAADFAA